MLSGSIDTVASCVSIDGENDLSRLMLLSEGTLGRRVVIRT